MLPDLTPEVSVVIPAYNGENYIRDAIKSVLGQSYGRFEIIVVDDGSTDSTRDIVDEFSEYSQIRYMYQSNAGHGAARNTGIRHSKGRYICFLDQDDLYEGNSLESRIRFLERNHQVGLVCSDFREAFMSEDGTSLTYTQNYLDKFGIVQKTPSDCIDSDSEEACIFNQHVHVAFVTQGCFVWVGTAMVRKSVIDDIGLFDEGLRWSPDIDLFIRIARNYKIALLHASTAIYRRHDSSMSLDAESIDGDAIQIYRRFLESRWGFSDIDKRKIRKRLALCYMNLARLYLGTDRHSHAMENARNGIAYDPWTWHCYVYLLLAAMPHGIVSALRKYKKRIASARWRRKGFLRGT
jgi:glycosyltransferase involved in cell wall biosynthesis